MKSVDKKKSRDRGPLTRLAPFALALCCWSVVLGCGLRTVPPVKYLPLLGKEKEVSTAAVLDRALDDSRLEVRAHAVALLADLANSPEGNTKKAVARALGKALKDHDPGLRLQAVVQLGRMASKYGNKYLITALADPNIFVREKVVQTLALRRNQELVSIQAVPEDSLSASEP